MASLQVFDVTKRFGNISAVESVSFEATHGELLSVLGPSGAGKTTILRCIAGLEQPETGQIRIDNAAVFSQKDGLSMPPERRGVGMVFQSYAVWPHMSVFDNVAFPLKVKHVPSAKLKERVFQALSLVRLDGLESRRGTELSAGQQQRVALARALVSEPQILLLDEPLSNLDSKLRDYMRVELKELQRRLGVTMIYVTHDHGEAFALSKRIVVMQSGRVVASGSPRQLFENPQNRFLAEFLGHSNILEARLIERRRKGSALVETRIGTLKLNVPSDLKVNQEFYICLRGRMLRAHRIRPRSADNLLKGVLNSIVYRGRDMLDYLVSIDDFTVSVHGKSVSNAKLEEGEPVYLEIPAQACTLIR